MNDDIYGFFKTPDYSDRTKYINILELEGKEFIEALKSQHGRTIQTEQPKLTCMYCCDMRGCITPLIDNDEYYGKISEGEIEIEDFKNNQMIYIKADYCIKCGRKL